MAKSVYRSLCILILIFCTCSTSTFATPLKIQIELAEPWGFLKNSQEKHLPGIKELGGIWIEVIDLISAQTNIHFKKSTAPYARVVRNLEEGQIDLSFLAKTKSSDQKTIYTALIFITSSIVMPKKGLEIKRYDDLYNQRIGIVRSAKLDPDFDSDVALFKQSYRDHKILINMLVQNRLDAIAGNGVSIFHLIRKQSLDLNINNHFVLKKTPIWLQFSKKSKHLDKVAKVAKAVAYLKQAGALKSIIDRYGNEGIVIK